METIHRPKQAYMLSCYYGHDRSVKDVRKITENVRSRLGAAGQALSPNNSGRLKLPFDFWSSRLLQCEGSAVQRWLDQCHRI